MRRRRRRPARGSEFFVSERVELVKSRKERKKNRMNERMKEECMNERMIE